MLPDAWRDTKGFTCPLCHSNVIRTAEVERFLVKHDGPRKFSELMRRARTAPLSPRALSCPDCTTQSYHVLHAGLLEIDVCATCVGLFLDDGEVLVYLRQAALENPAMKLPAAPVDPRQRVYDLFDLITDWLD